ncbi:SDR family oxidoreductase [Nostoc ellipsosporum NOK]|nr:SDR family oxidoreductase [Nostoc ellipsosporum NOK]
MIKPSQKKIALITGASRGIGRAIALRFAKDGIDVIVNYSSNKNAADEVVQEITDNGGVAFAVQADLGSLAGVEKLFQTVDTKLQETNNSIKFDILVNNAGIAPTATTEETSEELFDQIFDLNVKSLFFITQQAIPRLNDGGRIINLGTGLSRVANISYPVYSASKGAVDVLTRIWAAELGSRGITVNNIAPGAIDTDINAHWLRSDEGRKMITEQAALGRIGYAEDVADVAAFLISDDSRWITGQRIEASGGWML